MQQCDWQRVVYTEKSRAQGRDVFRRLRRKGISEAAIYL